MAEPNEPKPDQPAQPEVPPAATPPPPPATEPAATSDQPGTASVPPAATPPPAAPTAVSATPPKPAPPPPPPPPPKPGAAKPGAGPSRRFFLFSILGSWFAVAWVAFTASMIGLTLGTLRFLFPNVLSEPPSTFRAGHVGIYEENRVDDRFKEQGAWVIRSRDDRGRDIIFALSTTCTHLGCTPNWLEGDKKFKCPCHGSGFNIKGINFEGPAPRPLERYAIRRTEEGEIVVDKSRTFQRELGQWDDQDSFILL